MQKDINILVVDDEPVVIKSCERVLKQEGYHVDSALRGKDAMQMMKDNIYSLIFTDLKMPEMDGITLIKWIKKSKPDTGIVVITGYPSYQTIQEALNLGCVDYVSKPFTPVMLTDVTRRALRRIKKYSPPGEFIPAKEIVTGHFYIRGGDITNAGHASKSLKAHLMSFGIPMETVRRAAVAAFEAEMNVIMHAFAGTLSYILKNNELKLIVRDIGVGIEDIEMAMKEGYSTAPQWSKEMGWGSGLGLPNIKRNSDSLKIHSVVDEGTTLEILIRIKGATQHNESN